MTHTEIKLVIDTNNQIIKAKADDSLICNVWQYSNEMDKRLYLLEAKAAIFNEMCRLSQLDHTFTVSESHF